MSSYLAAQSWAEMATNTGSESAVLPVAFVHILASLSCLFSPLRLEQELKTFHGLYRSQISALSFLPVPLLMPADDKRKAGSKPGYQTIITESIGALWRWPGTAKSFSDKKEMRVNKFSYKTSCCIRGPNHSRLVQLRLCSSGSLSFICRASLHSSDMLWIFVPCVVSVQKPWPCFSLASPLPMRYNQRALKTSLPLPILWIPCVFSAFLTSQPSPLAAECFPCLFSRLLPTCIFTM